MTEFVAHWSQWRLALLNLGAAAFVAAGFWMTGAFGDPPHRYPAGETFAVGVVCIGFFGLALGIAFKRLFEREAPLEISADGIRFRSWSDQIIPWTEIIDVTTWRYRRQKMIILHLRDASRFPGRPWVAFFARLNRAITGGDIAVSLTGTNRKFDDATDAIAEFRRLNGPNPFGD